MDIYECFIKVEDFFIYKSADIRRDLNSHGELRMRTYDWDKGKFLDGDRSEGYVPALWIPIVIPRLRWVILCTQSDENNC